MEALTYRLDQFEGPLDLLLTLIHKNKVNIEDIPISLICDQYMEFVNQAQSMDMDVAAEFIVMASELMLIKSRMLLPRDEETEEDPRKQLVDALLKYQQAKAAMLVLTPRYAAFGGRMAKDTDEISVDKTFVADQDIESLCLAVRRIISYNALMERAKSKEPFTPMLSAPIVPVEIKIVGILDHIQKKKNASLGELLDDSVSLPDMIAIFIGVLELIKVNRISIVEDETKSDTIEGISTRFVINENYVEAEETPTQTNTEVNDDGQADGAN
ncbi:MAG: segregation/condensation protein A [Clostridia bacterium]|nr:segregation/condensation protein A [Clostridia bacterium]